VANAARLRDWALLLVCNLIWASQFVLVKIVQEQMGPVFATFFPLMLATLLLVPIVGRERRRQNATPGGPNGGPGASSVRGRDVFEFILIGVFGRWSHNCSSPGGCGCRWPRTPLSSCWRCPSRPPSWPTSFWAERMTPVRWVKLRAGHCRGARMLGNRLARAQPHERQVPVGKLDDFPERQRQRLLQRLQQETAGAFFLPLQVLLYSYYAVVAFMLPITLKTEPGPSAAWRISASSSGSV